MKKLRSALRTTLGWVTPQPPASPTEHQPGTPYLVVTHPRRHENGDIKEDCYSVHLVYANDSQEAMAAIIAAAEVQYPRKDGWLVNGSCYGLGMLLEHYLRVCDGPGHKQAFFGKVCGRKGEKGPLVYMQPYVFVGTQRKVLETLQQQAADDPGHRPEDGWVFTYLCEPVHVLLGKPETVH